MAKAKEIEGLDCGARVGTGIGLILRTRLEEMCALRSAALDWTDIEGVHDMRVASRRLRSVVQDFSPYFRLRKIRHVRDDLKSIADALGAVRDEDVAITALEKLAAEAPPELAVGIERFTSERRSRRRRARARLEEMLAEEELEQLRAEFDVALERGLKGGRGRWSKVEDQTSVAGVTFRQAGRDIIFSRLMELRDLSLSLYHPHRTKPLHKMRLAAKRLRYALELFAPCWTEPLKDFAKEIARLQTSLGELHDADEWIAALGSMLSDEVLKPGDAQESQAKSAAIWLLDYFVKERAAHFRAALARWHEWEESNFQGQLAAILRN
jgi:CHAD domain-containing protein